MIARALAGIVLGFPLAAALLALALALSPAHGQGWVILALVLFFPLWTALMCASYLFKSGPRAWLGLGAGNLLAFVALWLLRLPGA